MAAGIDRYPAKTTGPRMGEMRISGPELYLDNGVEFLSDHLYLATVDHLPLHPQPGRNVVIVVVGEGAKLAHCREKCCLIIIREKVDFFAVNRYICRLFDQYYEFSSIPSGTAMPVILPLPFVSGIG